jgi:hypothetical protein
MAAIGTTAKEPVSFSPDALGKKELGGAAGAAEFDRKTRSRQA